MTRLTGLPVRFAHNENYAVTQMFDSVKLGLRAVPEEKKTKPGRLCYIRIRYTDRAGELKPMERGMVNITVSGGKLLAAGSACPFHPGSYLTPETDTYYGEALVVVEAGESGAVEVAISDGERSDTVKIPIA